MPYNCPTCNGPGVPLGSLGSTHWLRCRNCGVEFPEHNRDSHCTVGEDNVCVECGVGHDGPPCSCCGGVAFHDDACEVFSRVIRRLDSRVALFENFEDARDFGAEHAPGSLWRAERETDGPYWHVRIVPPDGPLLDVDGLPAD